MQRAWAFALPPHLDEHQLQQLDSATLVGADCMAWPSHASVNDTKDLLIVSRSTTESPMLSVPWNSKTLGDVIVQSTCLMHREKPYQLLGELARGELCRVRNRLADLQQAGFNPSPTLLEEVRIAGKRMACAVVGNHASCPSDAAIESLELAIRAGERLTGEHARQAVGARLKRNEMKTKLSCRHDSLFPSLPDPTALRKVFDHITIPVRWDQIEPNSGERNWESLDASVAWCLDHGLAVTLGPLVDFRPGRLPAWLGQFQDIDLVTTLIVDFVDSCVHRFQDRVRHWEVLAGGNTSEYWSESRLHQVCAMLIRALASQDEQARICLNIDDPWGDYLAAGEHKYSPLDFVDRMLRSNLPIAQLMLEITAGFPEGSRRRPSLAFSRLLDQYASLGTQLRVRLFFPSTMGEDQQAEWLEQHMMTAMAKSQVELVEWGCLHDLPGDQAPAAGLFDESRKPKRALRRLRAIRRGCFR